MKILAYQPRIEGIQSVVDRRSHVRRMLQVLEAVCRREPGVSLILLPELATIEYSVGSFEKLAELAEPLEGETFSAISAFAQNVGCAVCYGFPQVENGRYFISQVFVGQSGELLAYYNKLHLAHFGASMEPDYFSRGDKLAVIEYQGIRFGIIICYDFRFTELIKTLVNLHQVDVILHPVAFTKDNTFASWHHFVICRAMENQIYFLSVNRAGEAWGSSILCPPWVDDGTRPIVMGEREETRLMAIDKQIIHAVREMYPFSRDKLADYATLGKGN